MALIVILAEIPPTPGITGRDDRRHFDTELNHYILLGDSGLHDLQCDIEHGTEQGKCEGVQRRCVAGFDGSPITITGLGAFSKSTWSFMG